MRLSLFNIIKPLSKSCIHTVKGFLKCFLNAFLENKFSGTSQWSLYTLFLHVKIVDLPWPTCKTPKPSWTNSVLLTYSNKFVH